MEVQLTSALDAYLASGEDVVADRDLQEPFFMLTPVDHTA
jgi:hypothetical protein